MKNVIAIAVFCTTMLFFAATSTVIAQTRSKTTQTKKMETEKVVYTCPMHHDVVAYKPGKCPKPHCGMTMVKKTDWKKKDKMKM